MLDQNECQSSAENRKRGNQEKFNGLKMSFYQRFRYAEAHPAR